MNHIKFIIILTLSSIATSLYSDNTQLFDNIKKGNADAIRNLIQTKQVDLLTAKDNLGDSAVIAAVKAHLQGKIKYDQLFSIFAILVVNKANFNAVNKAGQTALMWAESAKNEPTSQLLKAFGAKEIAPAEATKIKKIEELESGWTIVEEPNPTPIIDAVKAYLKGTLSYMQMVDIINKLASKGVNVNALNDAKQTALMIAEAKNNEPTIKLLKSLGAKSSAQIGLEGEGWAFVH